MNVSESKILANQSNALKSTGPQTLEGKASSSKNAVKHGLTSNAVVLPSEDQERQLFEDLLSSLVQDIAPKGALEELLTVRLAVNSWRWRRVLRYELGAIKAGIDAVGDWREEKKEAVNEKDSDDWMCAEDLKGELDCTEELLGVLSQPNPLKAATENLIYFLGEEAEKEGLNVKRLLGLRGKGEWSDYVLSCIEQEAVERLFEGLCKEWEITSGECWQRLRDYAENRRDKAKGLYERRLRDEEQIKLQASLPHDDDLEKVMRYEAHLFREFNRTLEQLGKVRNIDLGRKEHEKET